MKTWTRLVAIGFATLSAMSYMNTASAQATRTWVSGVGDDANPCSRTAPCKTFAGAFSKTAAGGEINCIDPGSFGTVTITKSMTISCEDVQASVFNSGVNGIIVNAGANDVVVLRGLDIDSSPSGVGSNGIRFLAGAALRVEDCVIRDNQSAVAGNGFGIHFAPSAGTSQLHVSNSWITGNGSGTNGAGIQISPTGSGSAQALIENTYVVNNIVGIRGDSNGTSGRVDISISDSSVSGASFHGVVALGADRPVRIMMKNVVSSSNAGDGIRAVSANALIRMGGSIVSGNGAGVATGLGGVVESYGTNQIDGNTVAGTTPTLIGAN